MVGPRGSYFISIDGDN